MEIRTRTRHTVVSLALVFAAVTWSLGPGAAVADAAPAGGPPAGVVPADAAPADAAPAGWQRLVHRPAGYQLDVPAGMEVDFRYSPAYVRASSPALDIRISAERSPYEDVEMYLRDYPNRFIAREDYAAYRLINDIHLFEDGWADIGGRRTRIISLRRGPAPGSPETQNEYLLAYMLGPGPRDFCAVFLRTASLAAQRPIISRVLKSLTFIERHGTASFDLDFRPVPGRWNEETQAFYQRLCGGRDFLWGIFYPWALTRPEAYQRVASIEERLGFRFPMILHYLYLGHDFPAAGMRAAYDRGQIVELTMQVATLDNGTANVRNASFEVLDGRMDDAIRRFARDARAFGHPFLFRLNNEMNTDWSQYSGVCTLNDPDIYVKVWRRIYRIFEEEGVDNAIWVFNPNCRSYPPMRWNHQACYYPGDGYVHVIGLTGYNTGNYYSAVTGERWASFREIYDPLVSEYRSIYGRFPWIIGEFASSSVGGDKAGWIRDMFSVLPGYPEIRGAVWWSYADFDWRPGRQGIPARRYWLDENPECLDAFRDGLRKQGLRE